MEKHLDTVVVGAGQAGLAVSAELCARGREHVVLERGRIGETWRSQRWDSFRLVTPGWMSGLPGAALPCSRDGFASLAAFVAMLERYAVERTLPVHAGVDVVGATRSADGWFRLRTSTGGMRARNVVVAAGGLNRPLVPAAASAALDPSFAQLHVADYRSPAGLPEGGVLVVGSAQSGAQATAELVASGRRVFLATSPVRRLPRRYRGRDMLSWMDATGWYGESPETVGAEQVRARLPVSTGAGGGATLSLQQFARDGVTVLGRLAGVEGSRVSLHGDRAANVRAGDAGAEAFRARVERWLADGGRAQGEEAPPPQPDPIEAPHAPLLSSPGPRSLDLRREGVGTVLWCTGFAPSLGWLEGIAGALDDSGRPRHHRGVGVVPGVFYAGMPWLRCRASGIIRGLGDEARATADALEHE